MTHALKHLAAGEATDPAVAPLLAELQKRFDKAHITRFTARDACVMSKAPLTDGPDEDDDKTRPIAIPPREYWDGFVHAAKEVDTVLVEDLADIPVRISGYRPPDYNAAVGGAPDSSHLRADAFDVWVTKKVIDTYIVAERAYKANPTPETKQARNEARAVLTEHRRRIKLAFAAYYNRGGKVGFGVYLNDIHVDINDKEGRRTWGAAREWAKKARAAA
jgi:hypothetical protein